MLYKGRSLSISHNVAYRVGQKFGDTFCLAIISTSENDTEVLLLQQDAPCKVLHNP